MEIKKIHIPGLLVIEPDVFGDSRGYFMETFSESKYKEIGINCNFVQHNESASNKGVIRGLHYQLEPHAQAKLVRVIQGQVFDVALDLRLGSPTFGKWFGVVLSGENKKQFFIPKGFAHGFSVLQNNTIFEYKCDEIYTPESERGIIYDDPKLNIEWMVKPENAIISEKDKHNPSFKDAEYNFNF
jgi:dTDP-4-dehydrorhamnose 3,5-epimerase